MGKRVYKYPVFQKKVFTYYHDHKRLLPWRETTDPYHILVSEVMLQQTQVDRVIPYYISWLKKWPTIHALSHSSPAEVLKAWQGLGYNKRGLLLHKAAKAIAQEHGGNVLKAIKSGKKLPGIGPYTSAAVRIFAANDDIATVDTNIRRILIHELKLPEKTTDKELFAIADQCMPKGKSRDWHNALMDYGATLMTARRTGIRPKAQQSRFEGSARQIRGIVLRHMLARNGTGGTGHALSDILIFIAP